jgi:hypothetical protein
VCKDPSLRDWHGGIKDASPAQFPTSRAEPKGRWLVMRIKKNGKRIADDAFALFVSLGDLVARQNHADGADMS